MTTSASSVRRQQAARALGRGEQHPAGGSRELGQQPLLGRDGRRRGRRRRAPRPWPGRSRRAAASVPRRAAEQLARAVRARDDDPVVARDVDRVVTERLDRDQRAVDDVVAEPLEPRDEIPLLALRAG